MQTLLSRFNLADFTSPAALRRASWGLVFALVALLGYTLASAGDWMLERYLVSKTPAPVSSAARVDASAVRQRKPITAFDPILANNVLHARRSPGSGAGATVQAAPVSNVAPLKLTLSGTFIVDKAAFAFIVGPDGRSEQVYRPGDCVPRALDDENKDCASNQGRLVRVQADRITVNFGGQPTVFMLEENANEGPPIPRTSAGTPSPGVPTAQQGQFASTRSGSTIEMHLPNAEVEKAFENFAEVVKQARVVPYSKDGVTIGFQIQNIVPGSVFQRIGLVNFDIVKGVNGESLTSADQALRLFTVFRNEKDVVLDVQRQNESIKLSYVID